MALKKYHVSENIWGDTITTTDYIDGQGNIVTPQNGDIFDQKEITVTPSSNYTFSWSNFVIGTDNNVPYIRICFYTSNGGTFINRILIAPNVYPDKYATFTIPSNCTYVDIRIDNETSARGQYYENLMLNQGSTPLPYDPPTDWYDISYRRYENGEWVENNVKKYIGGSWS